MVSDERLGASIMAAHWACQNGITGDWVECGVWKGGNSLAAALVFKHASAPRNVWLYDTFAGMTAPCDKDGRQGEIETCKAKWRRTERRDYVDWCYADEHTVKDLFMKYEIDNVHFVKGDVLQTLRQPENLPKKISILRLDTDFYESTYAELEALYPLVNKGGIIIIDDYGKWKGSRLACDEFFDRLPVRPFLSIIDDSGRLFVKTGRL